MYLNTLNAWEVFAFASEHLEMSGALKLSHRPFPNQFVILFIPFMDQEFIRKTCKMIRMGTAHQVLIFIGDVSS